MTCMLCGAAKPKLMYKKNNHQILRCAACAYVFALPRPDAGQMKQIYDQDEEKHYQQDSTVYAGTYRIDLVRRFLSSGKLLDIGCGMGHFLQQANAAGFVCIGQEISRFAARYVEQHLGIRAICGDIFRVDLPASTFDAITLFDVLEHVEDPRALIEKCRSLLRPGGYLFISMPNINGLAARRLGIRWENLCPPHHINYFTRRTLTQLLSPYLAVLDVISQPSVTLGLRKRLANVRLTNPVLQHTRERLVHWIGWGKKRFFYPPINALVARLNIESDMLMAVARKAN